MSETNLDKAKPEFEFEFKGETKKVVYDFWAMALFEEKTGLNGMEQNLLASLTQRRFISLLWAGMQSNNKVCPTEVEIGQWLDTDRMTFLLAKTLDALKAAADANDPKKKADAKKEIVEEAPKPTAE